MAGGAQCIRVPKVGLQTLKDDKGDIKKMTKTHLCMRISTMSDLCWRVIVGDAGCQLLKKIWRCAGAKLETVRPVSVCHPCEITLHCFAPVHHVFLFLSTLPLLLAFLLRLRRTRSLHVVSFSHRLIIQTVQVRTSTTRIFLTEPEYRPIVGSET